MKKLSILILTFSIFLISTFSLTGCTNMIDYIQLQEQNLTLEKNLAFERKFPGGVIDEDAELNYISRSVPDNKEGDALQIIGNAQVIINNGTFDGGNTPLGGAGNTAVWCNSEAARVTINGGKFIIDGLAEGDTGHIDLIYCSLGTIEINGGYFEGKDNTVWLLNCKDINYKNNKASIIVKGGTFVNFNPADCISEGEHTNFVAEGYTVEVTILDEATTLYKIVELKEENIEEPTPEF